MKPLDYHTPSLALGGFETVDEGRFVRVTGAGLWTVAMIDAHFATLSESLRSKRAAFGHANVLVDLRRSPVQPGPVAAALSSWTSKLYTARDRVAIVVASSLVKSQTRRIDIAATRELFVSMNAAVLWLCSPYAREFPTAQVA